MEDGSCDISRSFMQQRQLPELWSEIRLIEPSEFLIHSLASVASALRLSPP